MKTGEEVARARGLNFDEYEGGGIPVEAFAKVGLPIVVRCTHCEMTMAFPIALVDDNGAIWCDDCVPEEELSVKASDPMLSFMAGLAASLSPEERKAAFEDPEWLRVDEAERLRFLEALEKEAKGG